MQGMEKNQVPANCLSKQLNMHLDMHIRGTVRQLNFTLVMIRPGRKIDFSHSTAHIPALNNPPKLCTEQISREKLILTELFFL